MAYYPGNFYSNYPYQNNSYNQVQPQLQQQLPVQQIQPQIQQPTLPGKIVDSAEVARIADVPFGGYSIFPKADLSEIYIKSWNNNGTTNVITYRPVIEAKAIDGKDDNFEKEDNQEILNRIDILEKKLDEIIKKNNNIKVKQNEGKELNASAY